MIIDTAELPEQEAEELERLVEAADFFRLPESAPLQREAADYLRYTISVSTPEVSHTVHLTDPIEAPGVQALVEYLEAKAR